MWRNSAEAFRVNTAAIVFFAVSDGLQSTRQIEKDSNNDSVLWQSSAWIGFFRGENLRYYQAKYSP
jgi:hypothetical protein